MVIILWSPWSTQRILCVHGPAHELTDESCGALNLAFTDAIVMGLWDSQPYWMQQLWDCGTLNFTGVDVTVAWNCRPLNLTSKDMTAGWECWALNLTSVNATVLGLCSRRIRTIQLCHLTSLWSIKGILLLACLDLPLSKPTLSCKLLVGICLHRMPWCACYENIFKYLLYQ